MPVRDQYSKYQNSTVHTATKEELTLMLYNGCIKFMNLAEIAIDQNKIEMRNTNIQKAEAIISELSLTLNMDIEISSQLRPLYDFVYEKLVDANIKNDKQALIEAKTIVTDMRDTWKEAMRLFRMR